MGEHFVHVCVHITKNGAVLIVHVHVCVLYMYSTCTLYEFVITNCAFLQYLLSFGHTCIGLQPLETKH